MTTEERVRALLGNLKNWSWDVFPQFRIEKEEAEALRSHIKDLETKLYEANQNYQELEKKTYGERGE